MGKLTRKQSYETIILGNNYSKKSMREHTHIYIHTYECAVTRHLTSFLYMLRSFCEHTHTHIWRTLCNHSITYCPFHERNLTLHWLEMESKVFSCGTDYKYTEHPVLPCCSRTIQILWILM